MRHACSMSFFIWHFTVVYVYFMLFPAAIMGIMHGLLFGSIIMHKNVFVAVSISIYIFCGRYDLSVLCVVLSLPRSKPAAVRFDANTFVNLQSRYVADADGNVSARCCTREGKQHNNNGVYLYLSSFSNQHASSSIIHTCRSKRLCRHGGRARMIPWPQAHHRMNHRSFDVSIGFGWVKPPASAPRFPLYFLICVILT